MPFLTCKHPLGYCVAYAERAWQHGFPALVVLGGDRTLGVPRCVEHAWELRQIIRSHDRSLVLGGWANPNADAAAQVRYLLDPNFTAEFYLTQVVSHHSVGAVERFIARVRPGGGDRARHVRRVLLPQREPAHARGAVAVPAGAGARS